MTSSKKIYNLHVCKCNFSYKIKFFYPSKIDAYETNFFNHEKKSESNMHLKIQIQKNTTVTSSDACLK